MSDRPAVFLRSKSRTLRRPKPVLVATIPCWIVVVAGRLPDVSVPVLRCQHHNSTSPPLTTLFAPSLHPPPRHLRGCEAATGVIIVCIICARRVSVNEVDCLLIQSPLLFPSAHAECANCACSSCCRCCAHCSSNTPGSHMLPSAGGMLYRVSSVICVTALRTGQDCNS